MAYRAVGHTRPSRCSGRALPVWSWFEVFRKGIGHVLDETIARQWEAPTNSVGLSPTYSLGCGLTLPTSSASHPAERTPLLTLQAPVSHLRDRLPILIAPLLRAILPLSAHVRSAKRTNENYRLYFHLPSSSDHSVIECDSLAFWAVDKPFFALLNYGQGV